ncbi:MAG: hypothetical protein BRC23_02720 [Parcubacteria group bacterium SW_4_49_11]|nr:MAG: hypothetical protein BRC23_02720 [Parcubacteria group bacterium SW_4_49_11]
MFQKTAATLGASLALLGGFAMFDVEPQTAHGAGRGRVCTRDHGYLGKLNIRSEPTVRADPPVMQVRPGTPYVDLGDTVYEDGYVWHRIAIKNTSGWAAGRYLC